MRKNAFTLAEVLVTIAIIGIVAVMTVPTLLTKNQQKGWDSSASLFNRKLGEALKTMNTQQTLAGHKTTEEFVNELSKHMKIIKTCKNDKLNDCFVSEINLSYGNPIDVNKLKKAKNLSNNNNYGTETMGVMFANGISALVAYNPGCKQDAFSNQIVRFYEHSSFVEYEYSSKFRYFSLSTDALAILYDVSGLSKPNLYGSYKDIRGINVSLVEPEEVLDLGQNYTPVDCTDTAGDDYKYCGSNPSGYTQDYWAGAQKACAEQGMRTPSESEFMKAVKSGADIPERTSYYQSSDVNSSAATAIGYYYYQYPNKDYLSILPTHGTGGKGEQHNVLCIK